MFRAIFLWFIRLTAYPAYWIVFRLKVYYENKSKQSRRIKGKAIIVSNHTSVWDVALMLFLFPTRVLRCVVAEIIYTRFAMKWFLPLFGAIKVDRGTQDFNFIAKGTKILKKGGVVEIYPEGRLPDREGDTFPLPFKPSAVYLALQSGAPIIPMYTNGKYFSKQRARVIIGEPINVLDMYDNNISEKENIQKINDFLRNRIIELKDEIEK